jgi:hypothetical protein
MSRKYRLAKMVSLSVVALFCMVAAAAAAAKVAPVTHLHLVNGDANSVKLSWNAPAHASSSTATIDEYIIRRNGHQIEDLQGFSGMVDTSYIDGSPSSKDAVYTVIAVDSNGRRSPPARVSVKAPQGADQNTEDPSTKDAADGIQSTDVCDSIIPPDIRGHNNPTGLEKYGCGEGMNAIPDDSAPKTGILHPGGTVKRPFHDLFQNLFIQLPVTLGQYCFLGISAFSAMVMQSKTYTGVSHLFGEILQIFHGNPNYPGLVSLAVALALLYLTLSVIKGEFRKGFISVGWIVAALVILTVFLANPYRSMNAAVNKPLGVFSGITNEVSNMTAGTGVANHFNLTVNPTYGGNKTYASIRRAEYVDWVMFQYLPHCAIVFRDFTWATTHYYAKSHTTFCEKFLQVWGSDNDDDKDDFKSALEDANKKVYKSFKGDDQISRVINTGIAAVTLAVHNLMKLARNMAIFGCMILLLGELLFSVLWLIYAATGSDSAKLTAKRRILTILHWLKVPVLMLLLMLVQEAVEANIISHLAASLGFFFMSLIELFWDVLILVVAISLLRKEHREHKQAMERLGAYRNDSMGLGSKAARLAGTALGGAAAGVAAEHMADKRKKGKEKAEDAPADSTFDFNGFSESLPLLEAGPSGDNRGSSTRGPSSSPDNGGDGQPWDVESDAEEVRLEQRQLEAVTGAIRNQQYAFDPEVDVDVDVDNDVDVDAEVVDDGDEQRLRDDRVREAIDVDVDVNAPEGSPSPNERYRDDRDDFGRF